MTDLMLFMEFIFWLVLRCGLLILLTLCAFDILYIIDYLEDEHDNKKTITESKHKLNEERGNYYHKGAQSHD